MFDRILGFLQGLKLSLTEWLGVSAAIVIGGLVAALKLQGRKLHRAQLELAGASRDARASQADKDTKVVDDYYEQIKAAYLKNGGKLE